MFTIIFKKLNKKLKIFSLILPIMGLVVGCLINWHRLNYTFSKKSVNRRLF